MYCRPQVDGRIFGSAAMRTFGIVIASLASSAYAQSTQHYLATNLTSNQASLATNRDANLVNPWGLSRSSKGPWWVSDNGTGVSTLYDGTGKTQSLVVTVPPASTASPTGSPTGTVFNGNPTAFQIAAGKNAVFLFVTEDGTISGWNPGVNATQAVIAVSHGKKSVYKGATVATAVTNGVAQSYLYAADFRQGRVAVFDSAFKPVVLTPERGPSGDRERGEERGDRDEQQASFEDERLPDGYAPFNVQNIGGNVYVTFAKQDGARHDEVDGAGMGYVDVFSPRGRLLLRLEHGPWLNAPWGVAQAPGDFGVYSHDVLIGQFGNGEIVAFDPLTGRYKGVLQSAANAPIAIEGLWALAFGNDFSAGPATTLYFSAGPGKEQNGLFGSLTAVENLQGNDQ